MGFLGHEIIGAVGVVTGEQEGRALTASWSLADFQGSGCLGNQLKHLLIGHVNKHRCFSHSAGS